MGPLLRGWIARTRLARSGRGFKKSLLLHPDEPEDHGLGRSRGGFGSKFHLVTDGQGLPIAVEVTGGQINECTRLESVMDQIGIPQPIGRPRLRPHRLAGDKGYSSRRIRQWLTARKIEPVIPLRDDQVDPHLGRPADFDRDSYRRRSIIEHCVGWLKEARRVGTRFEKLAVNFVAMLKLAMISRYLRLEFSDRA